jgi:nitrogen fixation/metabolism regulation signal transduction histidine kinase
MEEANAPNYTEEERIAILTATERLKEMRAERVKARDAMEAEKRQIQQKEMQNQLYQQMMHEKARQFDYELKKHLEEHVLRGVTATHVVMDEAGTVRWNKPMNPKEWLK